jgi:hypothetical protein
MKIPHSEYLYSSQPIVPYKNVPMSQMISLNFFKSKYQTREKLQYQRISRQSITSAFDPAPPIQNPRRRLKASQKSLLKATKLIICYHTFFMYCSITYMRYGCFKEANRKEDCHVTWQWVNWRPAGLSGTYCERTVTVCSSDSIQCVCQLQATTKYSIQGFAFQQCSGWGQLLKVQPFKKQNKLKKTA